VRSVTRRRLLHGVDLLRVTTKNVVPSGGAKPFFFLGLVGDQAVGMFHASIEDVTESEAYQAGERRSSP
jgi:hypothetical protein